jgi:hypothetical protein
MADIKYTGQQAMETANGKLRFEEGKNRIVGRDAGNVARLLILADGDDFKMRVSKAGSDVLTAGNEQLVFNSDNNLFKILATDSITVTKPAGERTGMASVQHGLAAPPLVIAFGNQAGTSTLLPVPETVADVNNGLVAKQTGVYVDKTYIRFFLTTPAWSGNSFFTDSLTYTFKYYFLQETAA